MRSPVVARARDGSGNGTAAGLLIAGAVGVLALPSAVLAFSTKFESTAVAAPEARKLDPLGAGTTGPRFALPLQSLARGLLYPFTPAKNPNRPDRSVTVAVRLDPQAIKTITVNGSNAGGDQKSDATLRIAQTGFNLGVARGYRNFAQDVVPPAAGRKVEPPDLARYSIAPEADQHESRFAPQIVIDEKQSAGRAPRTFADKDDQVDLGGSYRLTRNLKVTAGVRYSEDHERLLPLTDGNQDSQAVYVGTQFKF